MLVESLDLLEAEFRKRVERDRFANLATIDPRGRVRSRIVHPLWEGWIGWILSKRDSDKVADIQRRPYVSIAYPGDLERTAFAECHATIVDDQRELERLWTVFATSPVGFDPAVWYGRADDPTNTLLRLEPWRVALDHGGGEPMIWTASSEITEQLPS